MHTSGKTVLITGERHQHWVLNSPLQLLALNNQVIITGRDRAKCAAAQKKLTDGSDRVPKRRERSEGDSRIF